MAYLLSHWRGCVDGKGLRLGKDHIYHVTVMMRPLVEAIRTFKAGPFRSRDLTDRLGYTQGYARNFISQATRQGLLIAEPKKGGREKTFVANARIIRQVVLKGGKDKEELLEALGLHSKYLGEYVALRGFTVVDHDVDFHRLGERILARNETGDEVVITNVGVPKKILTIET